jgi:sulfur transfer protein SufE
MKPRHCITINSMQQEETMGSLTEKFKRAGWDDRYRRLLLLSRNAIALPFLLGS